MEGNTEAEQNSQTLPAAAEHGLLLEIGWVIVGSLDKADRQAVIAARDALLDYLQRMLPRFEWRMPIIQREAYGQGPKAQPVVLFDQGVTERDLWNWDFSILITQADLVSHQRANALAAFSTALGLIAISTSRIDPLTEKSASETEARIAVMTQRLKCLVLHSLGHLVGLDHSSDPTNCMSDFETLQEIDRCELLDQDQLQQMVPPLMEIADRRIEEMPNMKQAATLQFYVKAGWRNRREILQAVWKAEPWMFPIRLGRLAAAGISALLILIVTAESWELGMSLPLGKSIPFAAFGLLVTTAYVVVRQRLLVRRQRPGAKEQKVIANIAGILIVCWGMLTTFLVLFAFTLLASTTFFNSEVIANWAASVDSIGWQQYLSLGTFVATIGLIVGALGTSFENQHYFRHVTFVDEEI